MKSKALLKSRLSIVCAAAAMMAGCTAGSARDDAKGDRGLSTRQPGNDSKGQGKRLRGVMVLVEEATWKEFVEDKILVDIQTGVDTLVNKTPFQNEDDARNECLRLAKDSSVVGIVVVLHDKGASGDWVVKLCEEGGLDCMVHEALGGGSMRRSEVLTWVHRGRTRKGDADQITE